MMMSRVSKMVPLIVVGCAMNLPAQAAPVNQWADYVIDFSSQYTSSSWSAAQALGAPNTFSYGDISTAWATSPPNDGLHFISVGYNTPVYSSGAVIRETYNNGFLYSVEAIDTNDNHHLVWQGTDTSLANVPYDFAVSWTPTTYLTKGLKVTIDTDHTGSWEEIDAIQLRGETAASSIVPTPSAVLLGLAGLAGLGLRRRR